VIATRRVLRAGLAAGLLVLASGCSGDGAAADTTLPPVTICDPEAGEPQTDDDLPAVGDIATAVDELAAVLGAPPEFFEINATADLVNLFVALNEGTAVQPWLYAAGELTAEQAQPASGGTFGAGDLDFEVDAVLAGVRREIPEAILESFYVHGDGAGNVQYGILASARCGGGLDVLVSSSGAVLSVDPA
jgi:hypothetical protein